ncbi:MAG: Uma2 family endonuclease [Anaerolineae bacterium]|nr:Uma2 family endonuclease [Anaerolineae bacterium]MDQ7035718.1 Uma2 family endonuclease [Anaerolineae bacterium]
MALVQAKQDEPLYMSEAEYLEFEEKSEIKHEYVAGYVYAMAGASWNHTVINGNTHSTLDAQLLDKPCVVVSNDLRLKVETKKVSFRYPDVMVICGKPEFIENRVDTINNPTIIIEVLSPATALEDRNAKLDEYTGLNSVEEYVLVSQEEAKIERYTRQESGEWLYRKVAGLENNIDLRSIDCVLELSQVYKKVDLPSGDEN